MTREETRALVVELAGHLGPEWRTEEPDDNRPWLERQISNGHVTLWVLPPGSYEVPEDQLELRVRLSSEQTAADKLNTAEVANYNTEELKKVKTGGVAMTKRAPVLSMRFATKLTPKRIAARIKKEWLPVLVPYVAFLSERAAVFVEADAAIGETLRQLEAAGVTWDAQTPGADPAFRTGQWSGVKFMANVAVEGPQLVIVVRGCIPDDAVALLHIIQQGDANAHARMDAIAAEAKTAAADAALPGEVAS